MRNQALSRQLQKLRDLIKKFSESGIQDLELQAQWGRYLCVLVAGFLENAIAEVYGTFVKSAASEPVANFSSSVLARVQNPKAKIFLDIARSFKSQWAEELKQFLEEENRKEAIDTIMANRHLIVHGRDSSITVARVVAYLDKCVEVIEFIERQCIR
jgi:hypothetical protein